MLAFILSKYFTKSHWCYGNKTSRLVLKTLRPVLKTLRLALKTSGDIPKSRDTDLNQKPMRVYGILVGGRWWSVVDYSQKLWKPWKPIGCAYDSRKLWARGFSTGWHYRAWNLLVSKRRASQDTIT